MMNTVLLSSGKVLVLEYPRGPIIYKSMSLTSDLKYLSLSLSSGLIKSCPCPCPRTSSTCPCPCPWTTSPCPCSCPWITKSSKIVKDFAFCKQSVMYDHVKSIKFCYCYCQSATVHEDTVKNVLLTDVSYYLLIYVSK